MADCATSKPKEVAKLILKEHQTGTRTLVVVNTVGRAIEIYNALKRKRPKADISLIHSRFRVADRKKALERMLTDPGSEGSICIATQVVEAGADISAATLITDLAPWSSLVQRFGRCNRYGLDDNAKVIWMPIDTNKKGAALPYSKEGLDQSASILKNLKDVAPGNLPSVALGVEYIHVIRRRDIVDLFDTTPDLSGLDIDISKFIRDSDDHDVQVFWRELQDSAPQEDAPGPSREELCSVSIADLKGLKHLTLWCWDHLERQWVSPRTVSPGMVFMIPVSEGCYDPEIGWTGNPEDIPTLVEPGSSTEEAVGDDRYASTGWQELSSHTDGVVKELERILENCPLTKELFKEMLFIAARWHDSGKAHQVFQNAMIGNPPEAEPSIVWGKTARRNVRYERRGFRHELASALAALHHGLPDIVTYLVAAHHGKVRLSIRSLPHENGPRDPLKRFARGVWDGDILRGCSLGGEENLPETVIDLSCMEFGEGPHGLSWLARMLNLRDDPSLGPFRLAYLEALLRAADQRASEKAGKDDA